jgi:hypothetical protein
MPGALWPLESRMIKPIRRNGVSKFQMTIISLVREVDELFFGELRQALPDFDLLTKDELFHLQG